MKSEWRLFVSAVMSFALVIAFTFGLYGCDVGKTTSYICTSDCSEDNSNNSDNSTTTSS
jgi:hypothetical protein